LLSRNFSSCKTKQSNFNADDPEILHGNVNRITEVIIYDVFNPPVASRIYAYTSLAQYEAVRFQDPNAPSFAAKLNDSPTCPRRSRGRNTISRLRYQRGFHGSTKTDLLKGSP
jgi:hypothetical protein